MFTAWLLPAEIEIRTKKKKKIEPPWFLEISLPADQTPEEMV